MHCLRVHTNMFRPRNYCWVVSGIIKTCLCWWWRIRRRWRRNANMNLMNVVFFVLNKRVSILFPQIFPSGWRRGAQFFLLHLWWRWTRARGFVVHIALSIRFGFYNASCSGSLSARSMVVLVAGVTGVGIVSTKPNHIRNTINEKAYGETS